eukprot:TRINITY_DN2414_c0_g1_i1.p1 TRINITY_DN2414_c0_g1~~TRINITY_DN2414_c0_g1_i1.p1  ORF type:complete len:499 (-),score=125.40 TRINITY_DN2414_c0_g1_i1:30-1487(-)
MQCGQFAVRRLVRPHTSSRAFSSSSSLYAKATAAGPTTPELVRTSYNRLIVDQLQKYPHKDLVRSVKEDLRYTYSDVMGFQDALATGLFEQQIPKEATYATALPLRIESLISQLATARANINWAVLPPLSPSAQLEKQLSDLKVHTLVWPPKVHNTVQLDEIYDIFPGYVVAPEPEWWPEVKASMDDGTFTGFTAEQKEDPFVKGPPSDSTLPSKRFPYLRNLLHTSNKQRLPGLVNFTNLPTYVPAPELNALESVIFPYNKTTLLLDGNDVVPLSQYSIINTGYLVGQLAGVHEEDVVLTTLSPNTAQGLSLGLGLVLSHSAKLVYASEVFSVAHVLPAITSEFASTLVIEPKNLQALLDATKAGQDFSKLKKLIVASSPSDLATSALLERAKSTFGVESILVTFGTQKTGGVISTSKLNEFKSDSVGTALPHTKVSIVDDKGGVLEKGQTGLLRVEGFHVSEGNNVTGLKAKLDDNNNIVLVQ